MPVMKAQVLFEVVCLASPIAHITSGGNLISLFTINESESRSVVVDPMDYTVHEFSRSEYWSGCTWPSLGFSQPRDQTQFSLIAGGFFTS